MPSAIWIHFFSGKNWSYLIRNGRLTTKISLFRLNIRLHHRLFLADHSIWRFVLDFSTITLSSPPHNVALLFFLGKNWIWFTHWIIYKKGQYQDEGCYFVIYDIVWLTKWRTRNFILIIFNCFEKMFSFLQFFPVLFIKKAMTWR